MCEQHVVRSAFLDGAQGLTSSRTAIEVSPAPETVGVFSGEGFLALLGFSSEFTSPCSHKTGKQQDTIRHLTEKGLGQGAQRDCPRGLKYWGPAVQSHSR